MFLLSLKKKKMINIFFSFKRNGWCCGTVFSQKKLQNEEKFGATKKEEKEENG